MIVDNGKHYLYRHIRIDNGVPFYIGVGSKHRKSNPYYRANMNTGRNFIWKGIYERCGFSVEILLESNDPVFIMEKEKEFIYLYGKISNGTGILSNIADGGFFVKKLNREAQLRKIDKSIRVCRENANKNIGTNHYNSNTRKGFAYDLNGFFCFEFKSGVEAATIISNCAKSYNINRKIDTGCSYKGYFYTSYKLDRINILGLRFNNESADYSKKRVVQYDFDGNKLNEFDTISSAAKHNNINKDNLSCAIRKARKTRKGIFKLLK